MILTAAILAALAAQVSAGPALSLKVAGPASVASVDELTLTATLVNTGDVELKLFNDPRTVLSTFEASTFRVADSSGVAPAFTGAKVKYGFEAVLAQNDPASFTVLAPGASIEVNQDLSTTYNFNVSGVGAYTFEPANKFTYVNGEGQIQQIYASVLDAHAVEITGGLVSTKRSLGRRASYGLQRRASFVSCSSSRQTLINTALTTVTTYLSGAISYLSGISSGTTRYTTWFGTYTSSRKSTVQTHYTNIQSTNPSTYTYDCSCTEDYYAYVYPDDFGYVYLCNVYWQAPTTGTDSKAGTIVHESSHFTRNGGTDDYAYGQTACKSLAISSPSSAVFNADSHEYFAENTPPLS